MIIFCFQLVIICSLIAPALTVVLLRSKLMAFIHATNSVLNYQVKRHYIG